MTTKDYLEILRNEIHSTVVATVDGEGRPVTRVIDIMLVDENTLYFLTARGKAFYDQLTAQKYIAPPGMTGGEGMRAEEASLRKLKIQQEHCLHCGNYYRECPADAVVKLGG